MSWTDGFKFATAVLTSLGGGVAIVFLFSSWLGKIWATRILEKEKNELEKLRKEHEIKFSKLHLERAEAIKEIAQKLRELDDSLHSFLKNFQPVNEPNLEEKISASIKIHNEFVNSYKKHRIFFNNTTADLMHKIALSSRDTYHEVQTYPVSLEDSEYKFIPHLLSERDESWKRARQSFNQDIQQLIDDLEATFRKILGIE